MPSAGKARLARICSTPTRAFVWRTIPSSSCCSSYARRPERLARLALLRRANSAAGILRPARRSLARGRRNDRSPAGGTPRHPSLGRHRASDRSGTWLPLHLPSFLASPLDPATGDGADTRHAPLIGSSGRVALVAATWNVSLDNLWRDAARRGIGLDAAWVLCTNGRELRLVDTQRTYSRAYLQFDLQRTADHPPTFGVFWGVLREEAFRRCARRSLRSFWKSSAPLPGTDRPSADRCASASSSRCSTCSAASTNAAAHDLSRLFDESLTVVYRVLFLMFAESRSLVPNWHPIYRESYTVESLRERAERPGKVPGLWEALQAIARLAHKGCRAGSLVVPPFNGRLFSPARSPIAESCAVDDEVARQALLALSTTRRLADCTTDRQRAHAHRLSRPWRRAARRGVRERARLRARLCRLETRPGSASARRRRAQVDRLVLHAANAHRLRRAAHAASAGRRRAGRSHSSAARRGSGDGQRRLSRLGVPISRARLRAGARSRRLGRRGGYRRSGPRDVQAARRAAMSLRRRLESDGGAARAPVALARDAVGQQAADVSRSPPRLRQQPDRRVACRHRETAAGRSRRRGGRSHRADMPLFSDADLEPSLARAVVERRWLADTRDDTADVVREKERRLDATARRRAMEIGRRSLVRMLDVAGPAAQRRIRRCSHRSQTN